MNIECPTRNFKTLSFNLKNIKTTGIATFLLLCLIAASCSKRYEDGPCLSFIKAKNRIAGRWKVEKLLIDGAESTSVTSSDTLAICSFSFFRNTDNAMFVSLIDSSNTVWAESLVRYDERMTRLTFGLTAIVGYETNTMAIFHPLPALSAEQTWKITRLKRKEMWMHSIYSGNDHELRLKLLYDYDNL